MNKISVEEKKALELNKRTISNLSHWEMRRLGAGNAETADEYSNTTCEQRACDTFADTCNCSGVPGDCTFLSTQVMGITPPEEVKS